MYLLMIPYRSVWLLFSMALSRWRGGLGEHEVVSKRNAFLESCRCSTLGTLRVTGRV